MITTTAPSTAPGTSGDGTDPHGPQGVLPSSLHVLALGVLLRAVIRLEKRPGFSRARLTEPALETWRVFRRRLGTAELFRTVIEDAAEAYRLPFDIDAVFGADPFTALAEE